MSLLPTVAIAGASGTLGKSITSSFLLPEFQKRFQQVIVLSRSKSGEIKELEANGALYRCYDAQSLAPALQGVDVLINAVGPTGHHFKEQLLQVLPDTSVKVYFPSEFGVDHYKLDFPQEEWDTKKQHFQLAQKLIPNVRICRTYAGLFLEESIGPWFGFDTAHGKYEAVGDPTVRTSYTSMEDVGRCLAILASMPTQNIPAEMWLCGDTKSFDEIAKTMEHNGAGKLEVTSLGLESYQEHLLNNPSTALERYIRLAMGKGQIDHTDRIRGSSNELVNPQEKLWKWKTIDELGSETRGRPWAALNWTPQSST